jgi:hypothetical protein
MLILRRSNYICTAYGIVTLKESEWFNITKILSAESLQSVVIKSIKLFGVKIISVICCAVSFYLYIKTV